MPPMQSTLTLDAIIFGGGVTGLWLVDELRRAGRAAVLIERDTLGGGQTIASQGIIHGGLKYTLDGALNSAAEAIREMPQLWRTCLNGQRAPDLRGTRVRAQFCHLWRTGGLGSRVGMWGAKLALRVRPVSLPEADWPATLRGTAGEVLRLDEQVIDPASLLRNLAEQNVAALLDCGTDHPPEFQLDDAGRITAIALHSAGDGKRLTIHPQVVILAAGAGNADLRERCGLIDSRMQRRPLHMLLLRGDLPELNGHCTEGARTRVTITTDRDSAGRTVWQVGGQLAEDGVKLSREQLIARACHELRETVGDLQFERLEWATYRIDRAEAITGDGHRPNDAWSKREGNVITVWPTKLALAPRAAAQVLAQMPPPQPCRVGRAQRNPPIDAPQNPPVDSPLDSLASLEWPRPRVALPPWEEAEWSPTP